MTVSARSADFQRSFVAMSYFWGARGPSMAAGLDAVGLLPSAAELLAQLCHSERAQRAQALAAELARVAAALDQRGLWK